MLKFALCLLLGGSVCASVMDLGLLFGVSQVGTVETSQNRATDLHCPSLPLDFSRGAYIGDVSLLPILCFSGNREFREFQVNSLLVRTRMSPFITICTGKMLLLWCTHTHLR